MRPFFLLLTSHLFRRSFAQFFLIRTFCFLFPGDVGGAPFHVPPPRDLTHLRFPPGSPQGLVRIFRNVPFEMPGLDDLYIPEPDFPPAPHFFLFYSSCIAFGVGVAKPLRSRALSPHSQFLTLMMEHPSSHMSVF